MTTMLMFIFAAIGMAHIMVDGTIFHPFKLWLEKGPGEIGEPPKRWSLAWFRDKIYWGRVKRTCDRLFYWGKGKLLALMSCYQCSGFWAGAAVGTAMSFLGADPLGVGTSWFVPLGAFVYGCAGSYLSSQAANLMIWIQAHSENNQ